MSLDPIKRHPDTVAFEAYEKDHPGSFKSETLGAQRPDFYLRNRLESAFQAGIKVAENRDKFENTLKTKIK